MVKERGFYKLFFRMFIVLVLQNVITLGVNLADNMMLGAYAESSLSGVAAINQVQFVYQYLLLSFCDAAAIVGSQYFGKGDYPPIKRLSAIAMRFSVILGIALFVIVSVFPEPVMRIFTTDAAIISEGVRYLNVVRFTYLFFAITQVLVATLRATGVVHVSLILSISTLLINCGINYVLIYGRFGAPELGVVGAAIGTLTARIIETVIMILYLKFKEKYLHLHLRDYLKRKLDRLLLKDFNRIMWPMMIINAAWGFNSAAQNAILGHMTARAIAANSVASTMYLLVKSMAQGAAGAASFIVGKLIGEGKSEKEMHFYAKTMQILFVIIGIISGLVLLGIRVPILSVYKLDPQTRALANSFLVALAFFVATMTYMMPTMAGIIRGGGGAPKWDVTLNMISIWGICIPLSFIMAFVVKASPLIVVICLNSDQAFKAIPVFFKVNYGHWAKRMTRDEKELAEGA